ncbi:hypothetical protein AVEN_74607-1 [Araneus ventricosus]|uniref:Uncharacterized protein n=1 Tax=Araneus ventricosus TaxID=182803 RepID=A0A4Y2WXX5_ARAVE|nr:hypothetical protein AVEN_6267-1 [Araneus ventricosus]GBO42259.1 hypothetical protein AVEN_25550-1 [Araneus ventricosus]GBO42262.1 hypothetical protein AVEN_72353-1 [Araneus ventricosus]GBO42265.1 hypothetical protein AVEN_74607-1 [Araneus ventricosus]
MNTKKILPEARRQGAEFIHISTHKSVIDFSRFSSYRKLLRTASWIFHFIANTRSHIRNTHEFTSLEFENARNYLIRESQRNSFLDEMRALENNHLFQRNQNFDLIPFFKMDLYV